jgi:CubicO group peptidase (beta-lactamase class C family)
VDRSHHYARGSVHHGPARLRRRMRTPAGGERGPERLAGANEIKVRALTSYLLLRHGTGPPATTDAPELAGGLQALTGGGGVTGSVVDGAHWPPLRHHGRELSHRTAPATGWQLSSHGGKARREPARRSGGGGAGRKEEQGCWEEQERARQNGGGAERKSNWRSWLSWEAAAGCHRCVTLLVCARCGVYC